MNTVLEHGVIRGPPFTDVEITKHSEPLGCDVDCTVSAEVHVKV